MNFPICVDLDGTLVKSDLLFETFLLLIKRNPFYIFLCCWWMLSKGKAFMKQQIAVRVEINPTLLPYTESFLSYLHAEKNKGRSLILATASDYKIAKQIADHLGIFSHVMASDGYRNLRSLCKRDMLNQTFGEKQYDYAGNAADDLHVWPSARLAILVNPVKRVQRHFRQLDVPVFLEKQNGLKNIFKLLRVHQYVKNVLIFFPIIAGHLFNPIALMNSFVAFIIFCLMASSAYLLNDLLDIEADRQHRTKCHRAFASGKISIKFGLICAPLFLGIALGFSAYLPWTFLLCAGSYYLTTIAYSFYFKKKMLLDVFVLAILYTVRIVAGIAAVKSDYSVWLISFSLFFFLSLAFVKRYSELEWINKENKKGLVSRGYFTSDLLQLQIFGTVSGYISVLVLALYINSNNVAELYRFSIFLWGICLLLLYWISRVWMLAARGQLHDDPVVFALKDKVSWFVLSMTGFIITIATL